MPVLRSIIWLTCFNRWAVRAFPRWWYNTNLYKIIINPASPLATNIESRNFRHCMQCHAEFITDCMYINKLSSEQLQVTYLNCGWLVFNKLFIQKQKVMKCCPSIDTSCHLYPSVWVEKPHIIASDILTRDIRRVTPVDMWTVSFNFTWRSQNWWKSCN